MSWEVTEEVTKVLLQPVGSFDDVHWIKDVGQEKVQQYWSRCWVKGCRYPQYMEGLEPVQELDDSKEGAVRSGEMQVVPTQSWVVEH